MAVNNFEKIKPLLSFLDKDDFYHITILKRRKDNPDLEVGVKRIKTYSIFSTKDLDLLKDNIIDRCEKENARAYIRLNKQNAVDVSLRCIEQLVENLRQGNAKNSRKVWDSIAGQKGEKRFWFIDFDENHLMGTFYHNVKNSLKNNGVSIIEEIPTKTGIHLLVTPFNPKLLNPTQEILRNLEFPKLQIQKDANTLLYAK